MRVCACVKIGKGMKSEGLFINKRIILLLYSRLIESESSQFQTHFDTILAPPSPSYLLLNSGVSVGETSVAGLTEGTQLLPLGHCLVLRRDTAPHRRVQRDRFNGVVFREAPGLIEQQINTD